MIRAQLKTEREVAEKIWENFLQWCGTVGGEEKKDLSNGFYFGI